jgi:uncharacterized protein YnzC (UPF0291/DUF896 family)
VAALLNVMQIASRINMLHRKASWNPLTDSELAFFMNL